MWTGEGGALAPDAWSPRLDMTGLWSAYHDRFVRGYCYCYCYIPATPGPGHASYVELQTCLFRAHCNRIRVEPYYTLAKCKSIYNQRAQTPRPAVCYERRRGEDGGGKGKGRADGQDPKPDGQSTNQEAEAGGERHVGRL